MFYITLLYLYDSRIVCKCIAKTGVKFNDYFRRKKRIFRSPLQHIERNHHDLSSDTSHLLIQENPDPLSSDASSRNSDSEVDYVSRG